MRSQKRRTQIVGVIYCARLDLDQERMKHPDRTISLVAGDDEKYYIVLKS
jgi:hypothetical protein